MQMFAKYLIELQMIYHSLLTNLFEEMTFAYKKSKSFGIPPSAEYLTSKEKMKEHSSPEFAIKTYETFKGEEIKRWNLHENEDTRTIGSVLRLMTTSDGSMNLDALKLKNNLNQQYKIFEKEYDMLIQSRIDWKKN